MAQGKSAPSELNVLGGTVERVSYLGDAVDYQVAVSGSDVVLRVTAPPPARSAAGASVRLAVRPRRACCSPEPTTRPRERRELGRTRQIYRKTMLDGLPVFTTCPVGVNLPLAWSTRKVTIVSLSWFAA